MAKKGIFIDLIHTLGKFYLYDVNTNGIYEISEKMFYFLNNNLEKDSDELVKMADNEIKNELNLLIGQGCLSNNRPEIIEHTANNYIKSLTSQYLSQMLLQVTKQCNFKCRYCAFADDTNLERNHLNQKMEWNIAKRAVDFFYQNSKLSRRVTIGFYGGEPLLNYDLIKKVVKYSEGIFVGRDVTYVMTTNLSILTDEMISFFNKYDFRIAVSLDGSKSTHDKNRRLLHNGKGTHAIVTKNFSRLKENMDNFKENVEIYAVTDPEEEFSNYISYFNNESLFSDLKITYERINTSRLKYELNVNPEYEKELKIEKLRNYLDLLCNGQAVNDAANIVSSEILPSYYYFMRKRRLNKKEHHKGPCVPGVRKLFVTSEGDFLPCEKVSEESFNMKIGDINQGFDYNKINSLLNIGKLTEDDCKNCICLRHCSICSKEIDNIVNLDADIKREICRNKKAYLKEQIEKHIIFSQVGLFEHIEA